MSPVVKTEMNGNVSTQGLNCSTNSQNQTPKSSMMDEDSRSDEGVNFNTSSCSGGSGSGGGDSNGGGGPMASTPIQDRSFSNPVSTNTNNEGPEQPTSSTEGNFNFANSYNNHQHFGFSIPKFGTLIPNRVFVGGISCHTTETELMQLFSRFGTVKGTKIIMDRTGVSKGYGFVTFETEEEARRLFTAVNNKEMPPIVHRDRRLNIAPAVKKQPMIRQNSTYGSQSSGGASSSTFSPPPPFESYYYGQSPQGTGGGGDFLVPPIPLQDSTTTFFPGPNCFTSNIPSPFLTSMSNVGMGQAIPGPNGSIIFLPMPAGLPQYQQTIGSSDFGATSNPTLFTPNLNTFGGGGWRGMAPTGGAGSGSTSTTLGLPDHLQGASTIPGQDQLYYFGSALIPSPH